MQALLLEKSEKALIPLSIEHDAADSPRRRFGFVRKRG
jgi:hypothetical protein